MNVITRVNNIHFMVTKHLFCTFFLGTVVEPFIYVDSSEENAACYGNAHFTVKKHYFCAILFVTVVEPFTYVNSR